MSGHVVIKNTCLHSCCWLTWGHIASECDSWQLRHRMDTQIEPKGPFMFQFFRHRWFTHHDPNIWCEGIPKLHRLSVFAVHSVTSSLTTFDFHIVNVLFQPKEFSPFNIRPLRDDYTLFPWGLQWWWAVYEGATFKTRVSKNLTKLLWWKKHHHPCKVMFLATRCPIITLRSALNVRLFSC